MLLRKNKILWSIVIFYGLLSLSCGDYFNGKEDQVALARVGDSYLYKDDLRSLITPGMSPHDSAALVVNYINNWASRQLLLSKSKINLPEEKLAEFDQLVADYKADLYTKAYLEALVRQSQGHYNYRPTITGVLRNAKREL